MLELTLPAIAAIFIIGAVLGAGVLYLQYQISRAATSDELDARGLGRRSKKP